MNGSEMITMREAIKALSLIAWSEYDVYFTPISQQSERHPEGRWMMYNPEGDIFIAPLHCTHIPEKGNVFDPPFCYSIYKANEIISVDRDLSRISDSILDAPFHVEVTSHFESVHLEGCGVLEGKECTCPNEDGECEEEEEGEVQQ